jgi:hypothetical protein
MITKTMAKVMIGKAIQDSQLSEEKKRGKNSVKIEGYE